MKKLLLPLVIAMIGIGGGVAAGLMLKPAPKDTAEITCLPNAAESGTDEMRAMTGTQEERHAAAADEFVGLKNQFIIPIVTSERVESLVLMSLSVEISPGNSERVYHLEPKLRDALLAKLFDHANMGGFQGVFTDTTRLDSLRRTLLEIAQSVVGPIIRDVLITEIARQDV